MPVHEVVILSQEKEADVGQEEKCVLIGKYFRVDACRALAHMIISDSQNKQSSIEEMDWDKNPPDFNIAAGCIILAGKTQHHSHADKHLPLAQSILDESVLEWPVCEPEDHLGDNLMRKKMSELKTMADWSILTSAMLTTSVN